MAMMSGQLTVLWEKFSFLILAKQKIMSKVVKFIEENDKNRRRKKDSFQVEIENVFDITKTDGIGCVKKIKNYTCYKLNHKIKLDI